MTFPTALRRALFGTSCDRDRQRLDGLTWQSGDRKFTAAKLGRGKPQLAGGGALWRGATSAAPSTAIAVKKGHGGRGRTSREGFDVSTLPTGDGDGELAKIDNLRKIGFRARSSVDRRVASNFRFYEKIKMEEDEMQPVEGGNDIDHSILRDLVSVLNGASWFGVFSLYFTSRPGTLSVKITAPLLTLSFLSRAIGVGAFPPIRAAIKAMWIVVRVFFDCVDDTDGSLYFWYWAICSPAMRPIWSLFKYFFSKAPLGYHRVSIITTAMSG